MRSAIGFLLYTLAVIGAEVDECGQCVTTIGRCGMFHHCASPTTCNSAGLCECPISQCSTDANGGVCVTTTTTTPRPDDQKCVLAYTDRCFEQDPYVGTCCSQCNQGSSNNVCTWNFQEDNPQLEFHGEFVMDGSDCEDLCAALNGDSNTRYDYCPNTNIQALAASCPKGKASLDATIPKGLCDRTTEVQLECSWTYIRGESASTCPGKRSDRHLTGSFLYSYGDHVDHGACDDACNALSNTNAEPNEFCSGGAIHSAVSKCPAAQKSLEEAGTPTDWCNSNWESNKVIANTGDVCDDAYRNDCWKQGAFKKCCENCYEDTGYAKCEWNFKGPSVFHGEECTKDGIELSASFQFESRECFAACSALSTKIKDPQDLCAGSDFRKEIDGCAVAKKSVDQALTTTSWCPASQTRTQDEFMLNASFLASDNHCQAAYQQRCYEKKPFSECCAKCSDAELHQKCKWSFHETTKDHDFKMEDVFDLPAHGLNSQDCQDVCRLLNNPGNKRADYCPGSTLYKKAQACGGDLLKNVPAGFCDRKDSANTACSWKYSYEFRPAGLGETVMDTASGNLSGSIASTFHFDPKNKDCRAACAALGYNNNLPSAYCPGRHHMWLALEKCKVAEDNFNSLKTDEKTKLLLDQWCDPAKSVPTMHVGTPNWEVPAVAQNPLYNAGTSEKCANEESDSDSLYLCAESFSQKCYNKSFGQQGPGRKAFSQCCSDCFAARAHSTCVWSMDVMIPWGGKETFHGDYTYVGSNYDCFDACNSINALKQVEDLCPTAKNKISTLLRKCPWAWNVKATQPLSQKGRGSVKDVFCKSGLMQKACHLDNTQMDAICGSNDVLDGSWKHPDQLAQLTETNHAKPMAWLAVAFTAMVAAAFVVYKSRKQQDLDGYVRFQPA